MKSTIHDVAKLAGVSNMTVSRVLNDSIHVRPLTRQRVLKAIADLHYLPNPAARTLSSSQSRTIGLVITDLANPFFVGIVRGVEAFVRQRGYGVILSHTEEDLSRERESLNTLRAAKVDGVIWVPCGDESTDHATILIEENIPTVVIDRLMPGAPYFDSVISDNRAAAKALTLYLLKTAGTPVRGVFANPITSVVRERLLGFRDALNESNIPWNANFAIYRKPVMPESPILADLQSGNCPIKGVLAWNNVAAAAVFREAVAANIRVPDNLVIATFGNPDPYQVTPGYFLLAEQDPFQMGFSGAQQLFTRIEHKSDDDGPRKTFIIPVHIDFREHALQ